LPPTKILRLGHLPLSPPLNAPLALTYFFTDSRWDTVFDQINYSGAPDLITVYTNALLYIANRAFPKGDLGGCLTPPPQRSQQSDLFRYNLEEPNFTYRKQILHIS
jgi:hypothetical protein